MYRQLINKLEKDLQDWDPKDRRRFCVHLFFWSAILTPINVAAYLMGFITIAIVGLITLALSWLAITLTAADLIATTDVREEST